MICSSSMLFIREYWPDRKRLPGNRPTAGIGPGEHIDIGFVHVRCRRLATFGGGTRITIFRIVWGNCRKYYGYCERHKSAMNHRILWKRQARNVRCSGAELLEFTLTFLPLLVMVFYLLDVSWAIFVKSTLEYSVRAGVRYGITITGTQATAASSDLTTMIKTRVQANSLGLLTGSAGLAKILVHYFQPPAPGSNAAATDVSGQPYGNSPGNIVQVSIQNFTLVPLAPHIFSWNQAPDNSSTPIGAIAADLIEPSVDLPPIGKAP